MRLISEGARQLLMDRIQCMRDINGEIDDAITVLEASRAACCGYPYPPPPPVNPNDTFHILTEDDLVEINEDGVTYPVQELAP